MNNPRQQIRKDLSSGVILLMIGHFFETITISPQQGNSIHFIRQNLFYRPAHSMRLQSPLTALNGEDYNAY